MVDPGRLRRLLDRQRLETRRLRDLARHPREELAADEVLIAAAQFRLVVAIEASIDIAHHIIASEGLEAPDSYAGAFVSLGRGDVIPGDLVPALVNMAKFRNRLVHLYDETDERQAADIVHSRLGDLDRFRESIAAYLRHPR